SDLRELVYEGFLGVRLGLVVRGDICSPQRFERFAVRVSDGHAPVCWQRVELFELLFGERERLGVVFGGEERQLVGRGELCCRVAVAQAPLAVVGLADVHRRVAGTNGEGNRTVSTDAVARRRRKRGLEIATCVAAADPAADAGYVHER